MYTEGELIMKGHKIKKPEEFNQYLGSKMQKFSFSIDCIGCNKKIAFTYESAEKGKKIICPICNKANPVEFI